MTRHAFKVDSTMKFNCFLLSFYVKKFADHFKEKKRSVKLDTRLNHCELNLNFIKNVCTHTNNFQSGRAT